VNDGLLDIVLERLAVVALPDEAADLLLAALDGDQALAAQLDAGAGAGAGAGACAGERYAPAQSIGSAPEPVGAYLQSLTVSGFRGIGPAATLDVYPAPGLTLVVGRNGSGKSSFAEGLEVLLTGTLMRWSAPGTPVVFKEGWQNKHATGDIEARAGFLIEGMGKATVARTWPAGADIAGSSSWLQVAGQKRRPVDGLGWGSALSTYRPFLSHAELEAFFGRPSELHDLLASVLGLDELTDAAARLNAARKQRDEMLNDVKRRLEPLKERLAAVDDERARACLAALKGRTWDVEAARAAAVGGAAADSGPLAPLRQLAQLSRPADAEVTSAAAAARAAADGIEAIAGTSAGQARSLAELLDAALRHHATHGDGDCPVCGQAGALTPQWAQATREHLSRLRDEAKIAEETARAARAAADQALALLRQPPPVLAESAAGSVAGVDVKSARDAWRAWATPPAGAAAGLTSPAGLRELAGHLETSAIELSDAIATVSAAAAAELTRRDDQWVPLASDVASWCADAEPAVRASQPVKALKDARTWLNDATADLRNDRLAPLADQARKIWSRLRQESNVDLGAFRLSGTANRRALELDVTIDGTPGAALATMSQGEVNALALSIFLPRATMAASPFRFLVIDDPVQAMDPAKVDGLAQVLHEVAASRQVIVFTHDNRLATAVRTLSIPATILEVTRRPRSGVEIRPCLDPIRQALKDARDLKKDTNVPEGVARRVVPGLCRTAVEAAFTQAFWWRELSAGHARATIEAQLAASPHSLTRVAALAMFGDPDEGGRVLPALDRWGKVHAETYRALNKGAHEPYAGDLAGLISDSRGLAAEIGERLP
jgi:recombinational DNA repair ATPase RecF